MSIITEALKKAQKKRLTKDDPYQNLLKYPFPGNTETAGKTAPPRRPRPDVLSRLNGPLGAAIIILLVIVFGSLTGILLQKIRSGSSEIEITSSQQAQKPFVYKSSSGEKKTSNGVNNFELVSVRGNSLPVLNGVMYSPTNPQAIINGKLVSEGDKVGKFTLIKIYPSSVKVSSLGEEFELQLP